MSTIEDNDMAWLSARIKRERESRGWSLAHFADRARVSKAMISKIERGEASPTAVMLGRLSGALSMTISALLSHEQPLDQKRLHHPAEQAIWVDPQTGYLRRQVFAGRDIPIEMTEVVLPAKSQVDMPASSFAFIKQVIWVLDGVMMFHEGDHIHRLETGSCLELGPPTDCRFENASDDECRYLVTLLRVNPQ